ncbi:MAG: 16S rRNA (guanine(966)-N(2))-methyltransferase RsmD [SAR202 cluster bacterium]|nr:16S rRNA (guanine(966)-N(2))-methyltransferase RsmD [SAR202 cluster bacterium]
MTTRISGGNEKGRKLRVSKSDGLRPTSERVRAAVFSIVGNGAVEGKRVLDLYAGTGALGIEALSRGAAQADFVESHAGRCEALSQSLRDLRLADRAKVHKAKAERAVESLEGKYGLVFADPPYELDPWEAVLGSLGSGRLLDDDAIVVAEHRHNRELAERYGRLTRTTSRRYGDTSVSIYRLEQ